MPNPTMKLPAYAILARNYPTGTAEETKKVIGGNVNLPWLENTCAVRVSRSLNYAGKSFEIPMTVPGLATSGGKDGKRYAFRVDELSNFLRGKYGPPTIELVGSEIKLKAFQGKQGIIAWHAGGMSDATGHFTLWDGKKGLYQAGVDWFSLPVTKPEVGKWLKSVELWVCP